MNAYKRIFAFALALCLVFPILPGDLATSLQMQAADAGNGTQQSPYLIGSFADFEKHFANGKPLSGRYYRQTSDFTFSRQIVVNTEWEFSGNYDGDGYTITVAGSNGMRSDGQRHSGVFSIVSGSASGAVVKNVNVILNSVTGTANNYNTNHRFGGIAGDLKDNARIQNCSVKGTISVDSNINRTWFNGQKDHTTYYSGTLIGGIAGSVSTATIENCYVSLVTNFSTDTNQYFDDTTMLTRRRSWYDYYAEVGGIAGRSSGNSKIKNNVVENSTITAANDRCSIRNTTFVGSLLGNATSESGLEVYSNVLRNTKLYASYNSGNGTGYAGGLIGRMSTPQAPSGVSNNYTTTSMFGEMTNMKRNGSRIGGFAYWWTQSTHYGASDLQSASNNRNGEVVLNEVNVPPATPSSLGDPSMNIWVDDVVDAIGNPITYAQAGAPNYKEYSVPMQKWQTTDAPTILSKNIGSDIDSGGATVAITLKAPKKGIPASNLESATPTFWQGEKIRYEMTYSEQTGIQKGKWGTKGVTAELSGDLLLISKGDDDFSSKLQWKKVGEEEDDFPYEDYTNASAQMHALEKSDDGSGDYSPATYRVRVVSAQSPSNHDASDEVVIEVAAEGKDTLSISGNQTDTAQPTVYKKEVTVEYRGNEIEGYTHTVLDDSLIIELKKPVAYATEITLKTYMQASDSAAPSGQKLLFPRAQTFAIPVGNIMPAPVISPSTGGTLANGISILGEGEIQWKITRTGGKSEGSGGGSFQGSGIIPEAEYTEANGDWETLEVVATALKEDMVESTASTVYRYQSKKPDSKPSITIGGNKISANQYYNSGDLVRITHTLPGDIYYTIGNNVPNQSSGIKYSSEYVLPGNASTVTINAVLVRESYPDSIVATETIQLKTAHNTPLFSIENTSKIPSGQTLSMLVPEEDLPIILRPDYYIKKSSGERFSYADVKNNPDDYYGVIEVHDGMAKNQQFTGYSSYQERIPYITYQAGTSGAEKTYTPTTPEIRYYVTDKDGQTTLAETVEHVMRTITLSGSPGTTVNVNAKLTAKDTQAFRDGSYMTMPMEYTIFEAVAKPRVAPATNDTAVTTLEPGTTISLSSETPSVFGKDVSIFYSLTGTPSVNYDSTTQEYTPNAGTFLYDPANGISIEGKAGSYFIVYAGAVRSDMSASEIAVFTYKIADLNKVAVPTSTPRTDDGTATTVQMGSVVTLQSATSGSQVFYSLTGMPQVIKNGSSFAAGANTYAFDPASGGIPVNGKAGTFFTLHAVAVKEGMDDSPVATFTYQLPAPVQAVLATPADGEVIKGTQVNLSTTTTGAVIFYEIAYGKDSADIPTPHQSPIFDGKTPIVIEKDTSISAVAVKDNVSSIVTDYEYTLAKQVREPTPSTPSGSVVARGTRITLRSSTSGAEIVYTKDGSDPTDIKNTKRMFGSDIVIDAEEGKSVSLQAVATKTGLTPSAVVSLSYSVSKSDLVLTANPSPNSVVSPGDQITLSTAVSGAEIHYTTNGSDPTTESPKGSTVTVDGANGETFVVRAIAATDSGTTTPATFRYQILPRTSSPSASIPTGAIILEGAEVVLTAPEGNIYYTTDGSDPTASSQMYTERLKLTGSTVLKAIAVVDGKAPSETVEYIYTMAGHAAAVTASQPSGTIEVGSKITLSTDTEGATIYYTTNGVTPTTDNLKDCFTYDAPITISRPVSIRMFAVKQGLMPSVVNSVTYTVAEPSPPQEQQDEDALGQQQASDKLFLFDQFAESGDGPQFEDIVLRDAPTKAVLSAQQNALPEGVELVVTQEKSPSTADVEAVRRGLELSLGALYDISLVRNGEPVQPLTENGVEIGIPIPQGYEDTVVLICRINDNGTVTAFPTRRSGGNVYAVVDHFSKYAVAVPPQLQTKEAGWKVWVLWAAVAALALGGTAAGVYVYKKQKETEAAL